MSQVGFYSNMSSETSDDTAAMNSNIILKSYTSDAHSYICRNRANIIK